ncbi:MAG: UDP-N-acetylmuramoyl-L-alanyl-D-glutamate--2,6-diaminopimelate ligase [Rhodospirillaceae bacterium]|nr:UDP-N-acetylmuramoyl-L-alanyl-D-glutamate--2,6-diaminopimelate ligase [Rhodospirillaceae bacterium]
MNASTPPIRRLSDADLADLSIAGLTADSREVRPGFLFAALPGARADGRAFIAEAVQRGAVAVLAPEGTGLPGGIAGVRLVTDREPRRRFARLAADFYPDQPATIGAVTGTNGKTSVARFTQQIWQQLGCPAASIGTLGIASAPLTRSGSLTTPDPVALHADLADLARAGITHVAMEASSHGLAQYRLDGVRIGHAAFTNLSRDHLDYHGDMDAYWGAKRRLFFDLLPAGGAAVVNADDDHGAALIAELRAAGRRVVDFGRTAGALAIVSAKATAGGQDLDLTLFGRSWQVHLPLAGRFQADNAVAALGLVLAAGADVAAAVGALAHLKSVRGRLELAAVHPSGAPVYVDYAHTPDALATMLHAVRPHVRGRLVVVFGCGGDRDPGKRPQMGAVVDELADLPILTDDNPRSEDPAAIRAAARAACPRAVEIGDRRDAIHAAVAGLRAGDVLVVAGKGHEQGQTIGATVRPFDDATEARAAVAALAVAPGAAA